MVNSKKLIQEIGIILTQFGGAVNYTKLLKILYFIDRQSYEEKARSVSGDDYANMPNGVVLSNTYDLIKSKHANKELQAYWDTFFIIQNTFNLKARTDVFPEGELSKYEKRIILENVEKYKNLSYGKLIELHHNPQRVPEWKDPGNTSNPLYESEILQNLGFSEEEIRFIEKDRDAYKKESELFSE